LSTGHLHDISAQRSGREAIDPTADKTQKIKKIIEDLEKSEGYGESPQPRARSG
jgi:hypothetical protein